MERKEAYDVISKNINNADKAYFNRKLKDLAPIAEASNELFQEIAKLETKRLKLLDDIAIIRKDLKSRCIHPLESLKSQDDPNVFLCTFCETLIRMSNNG